MKLHLPLSVGIIGGTGKTGRQFADLFRAQGCTVDVTGSSAKDRNHELIERSDIVIFAVPLRSSVDIIEREIVHAVREDQLLLDVSSLKMKQVQALLKGKGEAVGMHPLFGPTTDPRGQIIILCPGRCSPETQTSLQNLLATMGMRTIVSTPEEHDHLMALIQVIPHLKSFLLADVLERMGANVTELLRICTPAYELELNVVGRFLDDTPDLYGPIILDNPETQTILSNLKQALSDTLRYAETKDLDAFSKRYQELQAFFGANAKRGRESSEACIRTLASLKKP